MENNEPLKIKSDFCFVEYNNNDLNQNLFLKDIAMDKEISKYISNIVLDVKNSLISGDNKVRGLLVEDKTIGEYVGILTIKPACFEKDAVTIDSAVHEKYRHSDKHYGSQILLAITDLIFESRYSPKLILTIRGDNMAALNSAKRAGFIVDDILVEKFMDEGYEYIPYSKSIYQYEDNQIKTR